MVNHMVILDETHVWPRQTGKGALAFRLEASFQITDRMRRPWGALDALIEEQRTRRHLRLARDLCLPLFLVRSRFNAVDQVLEASGIADGYGGLTLAQPVRPPVQLPDTWRRS